jgi:hypothetical protein
MDEKSDRYMHHTANMMMIYASYSKYASDSKDEHDIWPEEANEIYTNSN